MSLYIFSLQNFLLFMSVNIANKTLNIIAHAPKTHTFHPSAEKLELFDFKKSQFMFNKYGYNNSKLLMIRNKIS